MYMTNKLKGLYGEVSDILDNRSPLGWHEIVKTAFENRDVESLLWAHRPPDDPELSNPQLVSLMSTYRQWKKVLGEGTLPNGQAFRRSFWQRLAFEEGFPHLIEGEPNVDKAFSGNLMGEVILLYKRITRWSRAEVLNDNGFDRAEDEEYEKALLLYEAALKEEPDFALAWINKGIALKNLKRFDEAICAYDYIINKIDRQFKKAWFNKGNALIMLDDFRGALKCFDEALELDPGYELAKDARKTCQGHLK